MGNKRIAAAVFLYFLDKNGALFRDGEKSIDDHTLVALTIMVAESNPEEKRNDDQRNYELSSITQLSQNLRQLPTVFLRGNQEKTGAMPAVIKLLRKLKIPRQQFTGRGCSCPVPIP